MDNTIVKNTISQGIDKTAIKKFAVYARNKLIKDIKNKAAMIGVTESGIQDPLSTSAGNIQFFDIGMQEPYRIEGKVIAQRNGLIRELKKRMQGTTYVTAYETLIEEVAYTWFNRIIAIRFMEVNNYMPDHMSVLSSGVEGINEPEFIRNVFETSFQFSEKEKTHIIELKTDGSNLAMGELFQYLFIKQCNALNANLPELFEKTNDYTELLITVSYNDVEGIIYKLIHDVPGDNFDVNNESGNGQVEIIGWLYQFYNTEPKATVFSRPKSKKIEKQDIPAVTQLFTPGWIVKYMVENSLGRLWIEKLLVNGDYRTEKQIADDFSWKYYLPEAKQEDSVKKQLENLRNERKNLSVEDIRFLDPAMGSFHIGIYAFDVFMQLYESEGYTTREAARLIVEKNLYGLDIDKRAFQLSYFTCMMQARKYNRRILEEDLQPNVCEIPESNHINRKHLNYLGNNIEDKEKWNMLKLQLVSLLNDFVDVKEYGSLINISDKYDFSHLRAFVISHSVDSQISLLETVGLEETQKELIDIINVADIISKKYDLVITNPPYMSSSVMDKKLSDFAKKYYPDSKSDMFAMFIEKCKEYTLENGYFSMITQQAWMFLSSYKKLRSNLLENNLINMAHLGAKSFDELGGEIVQTTSFVYLNKYLSSYSERYIDLTEFGSQEKKELAYVKVVKGEEKTYLYENNQENFKKIPGSPVAYWASKEVYNAYENKLIGNFATPKTGMTTGDNNKFLRFWYEVDIKKVNYQVVNREEALLSKSKWFPYSKGGGFKRWYGFDYYIINWENNGWEIKNNIKSNGLKAASVRSENLYFKEVLSWSSVTSASFSCRLVTKRGLFDSGGSSIDIPKNRLYILALLNSKVAQFFLNITNSTINYQPGDISNVPIIFENVQKIENLVQKCYFISENDWNSFETAPFFKHNILMKNETQYIEESYNISKQNINENFLLLKKTEEEINSFFIQTYGIGRELSATLEDNQITISKIVDKKNSKDKKNSFVMDKEEIIKNFISYIVGCMFERYSLKKEGLVSAGVITVNLSKHKNIFPSDNKIILITDDKNHTDDILGEFIEFVRNCYGDNSLEVNLDFIANALSNRDLTSREKIRNYFLNDFYNNHTQMYKKRPIYWLYDSGKQNGFKALVYMHRYDEDTTGKIRVDYLHQVQRAYERTISNLQEEIANSKDAKEITQLQKQLEKTTKQLKECRDYDERLGHMALERIAIDLDDGVKVNYEKVQTDNKGKFHQILAKIK